MGKNILKNYHFLLFLFLFVIAATGMTQEKSSKQSFPKDFIGNWKGTMNWYPAGKEMQSVNMQLNIQPQKEPSVYSWQLIYGNAEQDSRPYTLKPIDSASGHWVVDENNGILLDGYWIGNRYVDIFSVMGNTITSIHWLEGEALHIEMISSKNTAARESGKGTEEIPTVQSFPVRSYQKAVLYRVQ